nr:PRC-barrel domain-containing protein [Pacificimonas flava]
MSGDRLIASDRVEGTRVYDRRGNRLGTIENFMVDKRSGHVEYAILSFGGFLGMGDRHYPLPWDELTYDQDEGGYVVNVTEQDLEEAPSHRAGQNVRYDRNYSNDIRSYYGGMGW